MSTRSELHEKLAAAAWKTILDDLLDRKGVGDELAMLGAKEEQEIEREAIRRIREAIDNAVAVYRSGIGPDFP